MENFEKELFQANKKEWAKLQVAKAANWIEEHPTITTVITIAVPSITKMLSDEIRQHRRDVRAERELNRKERTFYDHSINAYYFAKRVPTTKQKKEIAQRKRNGEHYDEILEDMGLL